MSDPTFTVPPAAPSRSDAPATFISRANAFVAWFATLYAELVAFVAWLSPIPGQVAEQAADIAASAAVATDAVGLVGKSTSTLTVAAGTKTIHLSAPKPDLATLNRRVAIVSVSDPSIKMFGNIATTDGADDIAVTVASNGVFGSGSYSNWQIIDAAFYASGATAAELLAGETDVAAVTPDALSKAMRPVAVAFAAPLTLDFSAGVSFVVGDLTSNFQLANPTGITDEMIGRTGSVTLKQDATGSRVISYGTMWKPPAAHQSLSTTAGASDTLYYEIKAADRIEYNIVRNYQ